MLSVAERKKRFEQSSDVVVPKPKDTYPTLRFSQTVKSKETIAREQRDLDIKQREESLAIDNALSQNGMGLVSQRLKVFGAKVNHYTDAKLARRREDTSQDEMLARQLAEQFAREDSRFNF